MPKISPKTVVLMDGDLKLYKRARSRAWQATFNIDGHWVRVSTKCTNLVEAKESGKEQFLEYKFRQKNQMPLRQLGVSRSLRTARIIPDCAVGDSRSGIPKGLKV